jgi:hypothetical protein
MLQGMSTRNKAGGEAARPAIVSLAVSGVMLLVSLQTCAFSFAEALLRTCDTLQ